MDAKSKTTFVDEILGFLLDEPFLKTASGFPSPEDVIENWFLLATAFRNVRDRQEIPEEHYEALHLMIEDAVAEYEAAKMLGEEPDTKEELGVGYDGYDVPDDFAAKHQAAIWKEVIAIFGSDDRPQEWTIESTQY